MTFKELNLIAPILKALETEGYTQPTPIQEQSIPFLLEGKDLLGCAQTGTGKTLAFGRRTFYFRRDWDSLRRIYISNLDRSSARCGLIHFCHASSPLPAPTGRGHRNHPGIGGRKRQSARIPFPADATGP